MDNNVTRNLPQELENDDWDGMILHYLGLDHIGHKSGPRRYRGMPQSGSAWSDTEIALI